MSFPDITGDLRAAMPELRGRLIANQPMAQLTWFRVGGPAQVLFTPESESDLSYFLAHLDKEIPVYPVGVGSNLLVRDGGVAGVIIRLGRGLNETQIEDGFRVRVGTAVPDVRVAKSAGEAGIDGLSFYRGIPGCIGGALRMNAGAYESETKDVLVECRAVDRAGGVHVLSNADMGFAYRRSSVADDLIFTQALYQGREGDPATILEAMEAITRKRETTQPIRSKTGGSTFKNPTGFKAWQLIDKAGCRGLRVGGAQMSELHCNFLLNTDEATAQDIEDLGEEVRRRVRETSGVELDWEIKRIGVAAP